MSFEEAEFVVLLRFLFGGSVQSAQLRCRSLGRGVWEAWKAWENTQGTCQMDQRLELCRRPVGLSPPTALAESLSIPTEDPNTRR